MNRNNMYWENSTVSALYTKRGDYDLVDKTHGLIAWVQPNKGDETWVCHAAAVIHEDDMNKKFRELINGRVMENKDAAITLIELAF